MDRWRRHRIGSTIGVLATPIVSAGCFLVAPSDDELLGGTGNAGGSSGQAQSTASTAAPSTSTGAMVRFCDTVVDDPKVRFCEDFDAPDAAIDLATWTEIPADAFAEAALVSSPVASSPNAARLRVVPGAPGCHSANLERQLIGTRNDTGARPTRVHFGSAFAVERDGFVGAVELESCIAIVTVHGQGTTVGIEFQWDDGGFMSAYVDYPVETTIIGRIPRVDFTLDLPAGNVAFAIDGVTAAPVVPFTIPQICREARTTTPFLVGVVCDGDRTTIVDDVTFGAD